MNKGQKDLTNCAGSESGIKAVGSGDCPDYHCYSASGVTDCLNTHDKLFECTDCGKKSPRYHSATTRELSIQIVSELKPFLAVSNMVMKAPMADSPSERILTC